MKSSNIGGQAVIEGIMMKNEIVMLLLSENRTERSLLQTETYSQCYRQLEKTALTIPFVRGVFNFIDSMVLGIKTLTFSASFMRTKRKKKRKRAYRKRNLKKKEKQGKPDDGRTVAFSIVAAVAIFMILPYFLSTLKKSVFRRII